MNILTDYELVIGAFFKICISNVWANLADEPNKLLDILGPFECALKKFFVIVSP